MNPAQEIVFDGGFLRVLKPEDVHDRYVAGLNDPKVNRFLEVRHSTQTAEGVVKFVMNDLQSPNSVLWGVWSNQSPDHIGTVRIHGVEYQHRTAHIGACLFDKMAWGRGLGRGAIGAVTQWALAELGMRWIEASIYADNLSSRNAFLSAGYSWVCDIPDKYMLEGAPTVVNVFAARS